LIEHIGAAGEGIEDGGAFLVRGHGGYSCSADF